jgi:CheY-like chemotaxis protein
VFTDIQLAGALTGWDVAEQFRAADPDVPIIYASGNAADRSRSVSNSIFLNKPYRPDDVVAACRPDAHLLARSNRRSADTEVYVFSFVSAKTD